LIDHASVVKEHQLTSPMMRGDDVRAWQKAARKFVPELDADDWYGVDSRRVCEQTQRILGIPATGVVDQ
jgi:hypothetical protein